MQICEVCKNELGKSHEGKLTKRQHQENRAILNLAKQLTNLRAKRESEWDKNLLFLSRYLILTNRPYEKTDARQISHTIRLPNGSHLTIGYTAAIPDVSLPYGADRYVLIWVLDRLARQIQKGKTTDLHNRIVPWRYAIDYLKDMEMNDSGKNLQDLRHRWERCCGLGVTLIYDTPDAKRISILTIIENANLPASVDAASDAKGQRKLPWDEDEMLAKMDFGVVFSEKTARFLMENPVPVPREFLVTLRKTKSCQRADLMLFLAHRIFCLKQPTLIPWDDVRAQLWQSDKTLRRIKVRMREAINAMQIIWPEIRAEVRYNGLRIVPPKGGQQFLKSGTSRRRLNT